MYPSTAVYDLLKALARKAVDEAISESRVKIKSLAEFAGGD